MAPILPDAGHRRRSGVAQPSKIFGKRARHRGAAPSAYPVHRAVAKHERDTDGDGDTEHEGGLVSLDQETGELGWATFPVTDRCKPAVDDDGDIWVIRPLDDDNRQEGDNPDGKRVLVALDASDGSEVAGKRYSGGGGALLHRDEHALRSLAVLSYLVTSFA